MAANGIRGALVAAALLAALRAGAQSDVAARLPARACFLFFLGAPP